MKKFNVLTLLLFAIALCSPRAVIADAKVQDDGDRKMCWAHVVRWGFFQKTYDNSGSVQDMANQAIDRTLLGEYTHEREAFWGNAKAQIDAARQYGIDGFCINMVNPKSYMGGMGQFLNAAEGTDFKVALCIDNQMHPNVDYCITHIGNFLRKYYNHPNQARIDGKPVVFIYNAGMNMENWAKVVQALKEQNLEAYYIHRASYEWQEAVSQENLAASLAVNNGLYDFGCCGFSLNQMKSRTNALVKGINDYRKDGILCASVVPGYVGRAVGNYRPFLGSKSFIDGWEAILANPRVNWVCVTTWNDYTETTHIEPSVVNRDALTTLNQEYVRKWKNLPYPSRPAQPILSYHEEVVAGNDWILEVLSFPYDCGEYVVDIEIIDTTDNRPIKKFVVPLPKDKIIAQQFRLTHREMRTGTVFKVIAKTINKADNQLGTFEKTDGFVQLYPFIRRFEYAENQRTIRLPLRMINPLGITLALNDNKLEGALKFWVGGGKIELLRNGYPVEERNFQHSGAPVCKMTFDMPKYGRTSHDVYMLRYTDVSGCIAFSNPVSYSPEGAGKVVDQKVIVTYSAFDEDWPLWPTRKQAQLMTVKTTENMIYKLCYNLNEGSGKIARSSTAWQIPLLIGEPGRGFKVTPKVKPEWVDSTWIDGSNRKVLQFFGQSVATLPVRSMPTGIFTVEAVISANQPTAPAVLFGEQKPFAVYVLPDGKIKVDYLVPYGNASLESTKAIEFNKWTHVAVVNSGNKLELFINGESVGSQAIKVQTYPINSTFALGNYSRSLGNGFDGLIAGFALAGTDLVPADFQLKLK